MSLMDRFDSGKLHIGTCIAMCTLYATFDFLMARYLKIANYVPKTKKETEKTLNFKSKRKTLFLPKKACQPL